MDSITPFLHLLLYDSFQPGSHQFDGSVAGRLRILQPDFFQGCASAVNTAGKLSPKAVSRESF